MADMHSHDRTSDLLLQRFALWMLAVEGVAHEGLQLVGMAFCGVKTQHGRVAGTRNLAGGRIMAVRGRSYQEQLGCKLPL